MRTSNKIALIILAMFGVMLAMPTVSAAIAWSTPVAGSNHSSDISLAVTFINVTDITDPVSANTTLYHNSSGSWASVAFTSFAQDGTTVTGTLAITAIADIQGVSLNMTLGNDTLVDGGVVVSLITIDDTNPSVPRPTTTHERITQGNTLDISWGTVTDATSGLDTITTTITSPNTEKCATQTFSTTSGTTQYSGNDETGCVGKYTVLTTATDFAGNSLTGTRTFNVDAVGTTKVGSALGKKIAPDGAGTPPIVFIIVIIIIFFIIRSRK